MKKWKHNLKCKNVKIVTRLNFSRQYAKNGYVLLWMNECKLNLRNLYILETICSKSVLKLLIQEFENFYNYVN